jgi:hypothetical protein
MKMLVVEPQIDTVANIHAQNVRAKFVQEDGIPPALLRMQVIIANIPPLNLPK